MRFVRPTGGAARVVTFACLPAMLAASAVTAACAQTGVAFATPEQSAAVLVQSNDCTGCHGAALKGNAQAPALYGIERRRTFAQIAAAIANPAPPMPKAPLSTAQVFALVAYLSALDGGGASPHASVSPAAPNGTAVLTVTFPGNAPKSVVARTSMQMGRSSMHGDAVPLAPTADPHVFRARLAFPMAGAWTIDVSYDGKHLSVPLTAGEP